VVEFVQKNAVLKIGFFRDRPGTASVWTQAPKFDLWSEIEETPVRGPAPSVCARGAGHSPAALQRAAH
jgi:hypothetical protein